MNFIYKIFSNNIDKSVHAQFEKFGIGEFENKALVSIKRTRTSIKIKTSYEYINDFVRYLFENSKNPVDVKGMILYNGKELQDVATFKFNEIKTAMGLRKYIVDNKLTKEQILPLLDQFPNALFLLECSTSFGKFNVKQKIPKSAKSPGNKIPKADFCTFITEDLNFSKNFAFDVTEFSDFEANHTIIINDIIIPEEYKNDFAKARKLGKRKGIIIRHLIVDGKQLTKQMDFMA